MDDTPQPTRLPSIDLKIGFIGLGVMGFPIAAHLCRAGFSVAVYNRTAARAGEFVRMLEAEGLAASSAPTPAAVAQNANVVIICVGNDEDLEQVLLGPEGALAAMVPGTLLIDHTTVSADMARRVFAAAQSRQIDAIDAPLSGGQAGAESGRLAIMCGGSEPAFARLKQVALVYGARIVHVGGPGAGQTAKMANQMCIAGVLGGLAEAIRLVQASEIDPALVLEAISGGAAQSWQMENRWQTMVEGQFDFGFAVDWMRKDLGYALAEATRLGLESPVTAMVDQFYADIQAMGGSRQDTSSLIRRLPTGIAQGNQL